mgnify:CR=1 FL=1
MSMKALVLYQPKSEHATTVESYVREFVRRTNKMLGLIDAESKHGVQLVELYDVVRYPAVLAIADDGQLLNLWLGEPLPLIDDVAAYLAQS